MLQHPDPLHALSVLTLAIQRAYIEKAKWIYAESVSWTACRRVAVSMQREGLLTGLQVEARNRSTAAVAGHHSEFTVSAKIGR